MSAWNCMSSSLTTIAVDLERGQLDAGVGLHRLDDLAGLEGAGLQRSPCQVALVDEACQTDDQTAGVGAPAWREEAGEGGYEVGAAVVVDLRGQLLHIRRHREQAEIVPQPLDERAGHRDRPPLERIARRLVADAVTDRRQQAVLAEDRLGSGVEQQKVTGPVGVLGLAG